MKKRMVEGRAVERHSRDTRAQYTLHEPETAHMKDSVWGDWVVFNIYFDTSACVISPIILFPYFLAISIPMNYIH